ncbi:MAG: NAD(P)-dependent glycerol-3-phosphate dehydrogenase [Chloroflexi bacterium]|nr:NAD(P)-dependent glycerol-3-phosphate dehydrogenase [Chloroflexota bacterium]
MSQIAIIGATAWGTALGLLLARRGQRVALWARTAAEARQLQSDGENRARLPGFPFPEGLEVTSSLEAALKGAEMAIIAVPSRRFRENAALLRDRLPPGVAVLSATKGLEEGTGRRMSQVLAEMLPTALHPGICVLSGPNLAREIAQGLPATTVVAASRPETALQAQELLMSPAFRVYTNGDVVGVELGGAMKNVIALGAGMADGLGMGDNAKAALMARGLAEMTRLGVALGAQAFTFSGLAGLGDLVATCASPLSRNRFVGQELARGRRLGDILATMAGTAEGVPTTVAALLLAREVGVEMPIAQGMERVLFGGLDPRRAVAELMERPARPEFPADPGRGQRA